MLNWFNREAQSSTVLLHTRQMIPSSARIMASSKNRGFINLLVVTTFAIAIIAAIAGHFSLSPPPVLFATRWLFAAVLLIYAIQKRSLTTWILVSTVVGGIFGY